MTAPSGTAAERDLDKVGANHFILSIGGLAIGAFSEIEGLTVERDLLEYQEGGVHSHVHKLPGRLKYPNLVLRRGVTNQDELQKWFFDSVAAAQLREVTVTLTDAMGGDVRTWAFEAAFPVKWVGPKLAAGGDNPATEQVEIAHQGLTVT
ncbi:MAG: phage tail protein [Solirubrobacteraceae bacterium]|nr:phage tail protein [Solirubrobacteraceae bacterium]